jgi:Ca2+-binding RTX toxin-like protein
MVEAVQASTLECGVTQISAGYRSIDMSTWYFSSLRAGEFHGGPDDSPGAFRITADNPDPYSHASVFPEMLTVFIRLIATGLGDFDGKTVPHSGTLDSAVMLTPWYAVTAEFHRMNVPVEDFLTAVGSQSPSQLTDLLTASDDWIIGFNNDSGPASITTGADHLLGGAGNDTLQGRGGWDTLEGGDGDDRISTVDAFTEEGARSHAARVDGGAGYDTIDYSNAPFGVILHLDGASGGADVVTNVEAAIGSGYSDTLAGSATADALFGGAGDDRLEGGDGADFLQGDDGADNYLGGTGSDTIVAALGDQSLDAGPGDDIVVVYRGAEPARLNSISLGDGNDQLSIQPGPQLSLTVSGGAGTNLAHIWDGGATLVEVYLNQSHTGDGLALNGFSQIDSQPGMSMRLFGGDGPETIIGRGAQDVIDGGAGADLIQESGVGAILSGGAGDDTIIGAAGANFLTGGDGADYIHGGSAFDRTNGNAGNDTVSGNAGDDWVTGGRDNDQLLGGEGNDILNGNLGNDTAQGDAGADTVRGGQGDDVLYGGNGNDYLTGDLGDDTLTGGTGVDTFRAFAGGGRDVVTDFNVAEGDRIQFDPGTTYTATQAGADVVLDLGGGAQMVLKNVALDSPTPGWIVGG